MAEQRQDGHLSSESGQLPGENPWEVDRFQDGYRENIYEENPFDNAWTESANQPDPRPPQPPAQQEAAVSPPARAKKPRQAYRSSDLEL